MNGGERSQGRRARRSAGALGLLDSTPGRIVLGPPLDSDLEITGLAVDSREVKDGFLFAALKGVKADGAKFAPYAIRQGAAAVLASLDGALRAAAELDGFPVPFVIDPDPRARLAQIAARFHGRQPEVMVAVTGTNGKTSTASFCRQLWAALGRSAASFGTTGVEGDGFDEPLSHTTPEPTELHALLARLAEKGATHAAMEASSHGLAQRRLDGVALKAAALTNITRDHLDYHPDFADYAAAKLRLFSDLLPEGGAAVLNADDPIFATARAVVAARRLRAIPVGRSAEAGPGLRILGTEFHDDGQTVRFAFAGAEQAARLSLIGEFQASNALTAAGLLLGCGEDPAAVFAALPALCGVRGRMELVARRSNGGAVFVDYAHTPDALTTALTAMRAHTPGRLLVVFGAGGDRDPGKRPLMGRAAAAAADLVFVTDDNPRSEDPAAIRAAVLQGALAVSPDASDAGARDEAILAAVDALQPGDRLLIAGKGHETGQVIGTEILPFDDAEQARAAVAALDGLDQWEDA